jgi:hypothetical protein
MAFCKPETVAARLPHAPLQTDPNTSWIWLYSVSSSLLRRQ